MRADLLTSFLIATYIAVGYSGLTSRQNLLRCRSCSRASDLSDCIDLVSCDATLEDCYLEQIITDQHRVEFNGGCRSKSVCAQTSASTSVGKKRATDGCSSCCNTGDDCNKRLCGIKDLYFAVENHLSNKIRHETSCIATATITSPKCYICDHWADLWESVRCIWPRHCQRNEVCYLSQRDIAGAFTYYYGCLSKLKCQSLMRSAYEDYKICVANVTLPPSGETWSTRCSNIGARSASLCHFCCADDECNLGDCQANNERSFKLALKGYLDMNTLKEHL